MAIFRRGLDDSGERQRDISIVRLWFPHRNIKPLRDAFLWLGAAPPGGRQVLVFPLAMTNNAPVEIPT